MGLLRFPLSLLRAVLWEEFQPINPEICLGRGERWLSPPRDLCPEPFQLSCSLMPDTPTLLPFRDASVFDPFCSHLLSCVVFVFSSVPEEVWGGQAPPGHAHLPGHFLRLDLPEPNIFRPEASSSGHCLALSPVLGGSRFTWLAITSSLGLSEICRSPLPHGRA